MKTSTSKLFLPVVIGILFLMVFSSAWASTYYVDATAGNDANNGFSATSAWKSIAKVNSTGFQPGDQILFKRGGVWREQLTASSNGTSASPIVYADFGSGNEPVISGADILTGFSQVSAGVYTKSNVATEPFVVIYNGKKLTANRGALTSVGLNQWDWSANTLYVGLGVSPDNGVLEAGVRTYAIDIVGKSYINLKNLKVTGARQVGIMLEGGSSNCTVMNNIVTNTGSLGFQSGIMVWGGTNNTISSNTVSSAYIGIYLSGWNGPTTTQNNVTGNIVNHCDATGICVAMGASTNTVENNDVSFNNQIYDDQGGIYTYMCGTGNIFRYNNSHQNGTATTRSTGIQIDIASVSAQVYDNLFWGNSNGGVALTGSGHLIYNNTLYHNGEFGYDVGEISIFSSGSNMTVINNIAVPSNGKHVFRVSNGSTAGHLINYNCYQASAGSMFDWGSNDYTFSGWVTASGGNDANSKTADPAFVDPANGNFRLQASSPCIDSGKNLGSPYNLGLDPRSTSFPFGVMDQNQFGKGWEIGAFVFPGIAPPTNLRVL